MIQAIQEWLDNKFLNNNPYRGYFDYASTTPISRKVQERMRLMYRYAYAHPSSFHRKGVTSQQTITDARATIARLAQVQPRGVAFTRGGTEAINIVIQGVCLARYEQGKPLPHVIMSSIEHSAVYKTLYALEAMEAITLSTCPVTSDGCIDCDALQKMLTPQTVLVTMMAVNNETGAVQPISDIARLVRHYAQRNGIDIVMHSDMAQAVDTLFFEKRIPCDIVTITASKWYGPKDGGVIIAKDPSRIESLSPILYGGSQEYAIRPGTIDAVICDATACALQERYDNRYKYHEHTNAMQQRFESSILKIFPDAYIYSNNSSRSPSITLVGFDDTSNEELVLGLDARGFCVGSQSACSLVDESLSHVIHAMTYNDPGSYDHEVSHRGRIRVSYGIYTTKQDVDRLVEALQDVVPRIRSSHALVRNNA